MRTTFSVFSSRWSLLVWEGSGWAHVGVKGVQANQGSWVAGVLALADAHAWCGSDPDRRWAHRGSRYVTQICRKIHVLSQIPRGTVRVSDAPARSLRNAFDSSSCASARDKSKPQVDPCKKKKGHVSVRFLRDFHLAWWQVPHNQRAQRHPDPPGPFLTRSADQDVPRSAGHWLMQPIV